MCIILDLHFAVLHIQQLLYLWVFVFIQGGFFNWPSPFSVPKRKLSSSQSEPFPVTGFTGTVALIGNFLFGTEVGGTSEEKTTRYDGVYVLGYSI